jgi:hypothetical protein
MAFRRVGDAEVLAFGRDRDIESVFGNVNRPKLAGGAREAARTRGPTEGSQS